MFRIVPGLIVCALGVGCATPLEERLPPVPADEPTAHPQARASWDAFADAFHPEVLPATQASLAQLQDETTDARACTRHRAGLEAYLDRVPVDLAMWQTAAVCADRLDDEAWARDSRRQMEVLAAFALRDGAGATPWFPAPVLSSADVPILAGRQGREVLWMRYQSLSSFRHLLLEAGVRDEQGRQHRMYFDLLEGLLGFQPDDPGLALPGVRRSLMFGMLEEAAIGGDPLALTGYLNVDMVTGEINPVPAMRALKRAWEAGEPGAGLYYLESCLGEGVTCDETGVPGMIAELQEADIGEAHALEAGRLILQEDRARNDPDVSAALDRAKARLGAGSAWFYLASVLDRSTAGNGANPHERIVRRLLTDAARAGNHMAGTRLAAMLLGEVDDAASLRRFRRYLNPAAEAGVPGALFYRSLIEGPHTQRGQPWLEAAARRGLPEAQLLLGLATISRGDDAKGRDWLRQSALGGSLVGGRELGRHYLLDGDTEQARAWFSSGVMLADPEAGAYLTALFILHPELDPDEDPDPGWTMLAETLDEAGAETAILVADAFFETPPFNDHPDTGRRVLEFLSGKGAGLASVSLGQRLEAGDGMDRDPESARRWFRTGWDQGEPEGAYELGLARLNGTGGSTDLHGGLEKLQLAAEEGVAWATNDLAWTLCTGEFGVETEPERGLALIREMIAAQESAHPYNFSTLASCKAATGAFEAARANQRKALQQTRALEPDNEEVIGEMEQRLSVYESNQPWRAGQEAQ